MEFIPMVWTFLVLIAPGLTVILVARRHQSVLGKVFDNVPLILSGSVVVSLSLGAVSLGICGVIGLGLETAAALTWVMALAALYLLRLNPRDSRAPPRIEFPVLVLAIVVGMVMYANGGLTERLADSWWHMAYARKIAFADSIFLDNHHVLGRSEQRTFYPFLWHGFLAQIHSLCAATFESIWHAVTILVSVIAVLGYYSLADSLKMKPLASFIAVVLFVVTIGGLNSYFRVNGWPGNAGYVFWYAFTAMLFKSLDANSPRVAMVLILVPALLTLGILHTAVGGFTVAALFVYVAAWWVSREINPRIRKRHTEAEIDYLRLRPILFLVMAAILLMTGYRLLFDASPWPLSAKEASWLFSGIGLVLALMVLILGLARRLLSDSGFRAILILVIVTATAVLVDWNHLMALFDPRIEVFWNVAEVQRPQVVETIFGDGRIPHWSHQVRQVLLPLGLVATAVSVVLVCLHPARATVFCAANAVVALLVISSPWLFTALLQLTEYSSAYRIHLLLFHPLILGMAADQCIRCILQQDGRNG